MPNYYDKYTTELIKPKVSVATDYELPLVLLDPNQEPDWDLLSVFDDFTPITRLRRGDLVCLKELSEDSAWAPLALADVIPRVWEVRFIASLWARDAMSLLHCMPDVVDGEHLRNMLLARYGHRGRVGRGAFSLSPAESDRAVVYAHGYPHGMYPNTAAWIPESKLVKLPHRDPIQPWETVVNHAGAEFHGYDGSQLLRPYHFDFAPDDYSHGSNLGHPFEWEEPNVQTLCLLGLEDRLFDPIVRGRSRRLRPLDIDHPLALTDLK
jgi:hypothetical protein